MRPRFSGSARNRHSVAMVAHTTLARRTRKKTEISGFRQAAERKHRGHYSPISTMNAQRTRNHCSACARTKRLTAVAQVVSGAIMLMSEALSAIAGHAYRVWRLGGMLRPCIDEHRPQACKRRSLLPIRCLATVSGPFTSAAERRKTSPRAGPGVR
jgi:hypothetical protein